MNQNPNRQNTVLGIGAILLWSTTIAFSRSLTEQLGTLTAAALIYSLAGAAGLAAAWFQPGGLRALVRQPARYLLGCGGLFVLYIAALYLSIGGAESRVQVLVIGLINYLWPGLSLVFSIPLLGRKAKPLLPLGILIALAGVGLATLNGSGVAAQDALGEGTGSLLPYGLALTAAVAWGLYTNLSRRWAAESEGGSVPLFLLASGLLLAGLRAFASETSVWSMGAGLELAYMAVFPGMLAYVLWDTAVRKGEITLLSSLSYLTPLLSTLISTVVLRVAAGPGLWAGALLVIVGAWLSRISVVEPVSSAGESRVIT